MAELCQTGLSGLPASHKVSCFDPSAQRHLGAKIEARRPIRSREGGFFEFACHSAAGLPASGGQFYRKTLIREGLLDMPMGNRRFLPESRKNRGE
jgi:hypothetical protein